MFWVVVCGGFRRSVRRRWLGRLVRVLWALAAAMLTIQPEITAWIAHQPVNYRQVAVAFCVALIGYFARDANVSSEAQGGKAAETAAKP